MTLPACRVAIVCAAALGGGCVAGGSPPDAPPLGMILRDDGQLYAGVARVDITPIVGETYTDLDGDYTFDGCMTDPGATRSSCTEPFDDQNGDGRFEPTWMGGWGGGGRAARGVHDPQYATATTISLDRSYVILISIDAVGLLEYRTGLIRDALAAAGVDRDRIVVTATHDHQSADTVGLWGDSDELLSGFDGEYQDYLDAGAFDAAELASGAMVGVAATQGAIHLSSFDAALSGEPFGGTNPDPTMHGGVRDNRDPSVVDDQVLALALEDAGGERVVTVVNYSGHPEVVGYQNDLLSSDYIGFLRSFIEETDGGTAMFLPAAVGGMQSAHEGTFPAIDADGERVTDETGAPTFIVGDSYEYARTVGVTIAQAARAALTDASEWDALSVTSTPVWLPVSNKGFEVALRTDLLDQPWETLDRSADCPGYSETSDVMGCVHTELLTLGLGPTSLLTIPGELLPELFWGLPDDPSFADADARVGSAYFPRHTSACATTDWETCRVSETVGECDCLEMHAVPYTLAYDDGIGPISMVLPGTYRGVLGLANGYVGYVIPEPDFSAVAGPLTGLEGNHAEEWYSAGAGIAPTIQTALLSQ